MSCTFAGNAMATDVSDNWYNINTLVEGCLFSYAPVTNTTGDVVLDCGADGVFNSTPYAMALTASSIQNLNTNALDQTMSTGNNASTTPSSGATSTTAGAHEMLMGGVFTSGPLSDADGTWSNSFNNGQKDGTADATAAHNIKVSEGYLAVSATGAYTAAKTGITSRVWVALIGTYR